MVLPASPFLRRLIACLILVVALAACGGNGGGDDEPEGQETTEEAVQPTGELAGVLLVAGDLPPGWDLEASGEGSAEVSEGESGFCGTAIPSTENATADAVIQFSKGEATTRLVESVARYETVEQATAAFDQVEQAVQNCRQWDVTADDTVTTFTLTGAPFPNLADETLAVKVNGEFTVSGEAAKGAPTDGFVTGDTVIVRHQGTIVVIRHFAIGLGTQPDLATGETEPIARRAVEKVQAA